MKKMIKKVIVAVLAMAMALGMMTVATSAAAGDKTIVVVLSGELATGEKLLLDIEGQSAGITSSATVNTSLGWGRDMYEFTKDSSNNKIYKIVINGDVGADKYCNFQIIRLSATNSLVKGVKYYPQDGRDVFNGNDTVYITFDLNAGDWSVVTASATDPTAITVDEVEAAIAAIGTVVLTDECKGLIDAASAKVSAYNGATADIDNYSTYTAAKARWDELVENGAGTLKIHVKHNWSAVSVYTYGVNDGTVHAAGDWPGTAAVDNANNSGWGDVTVTTESAVNVIVNGDGKQSETKYVVAGEYWITVSNDVIDSVSSTAPSGWSTGTVTPPPVDDDEEETTTAADDDDDETTTTTAADDDDDETTTTTVADEDDDETTTVADEDTNTYHVAGEAGLCGEAWNPAANQMTKNADGTWSIKFTDVKAGTYAFKIATNGAWDNGEYNLDGDASNNGPNASITVEEDGSTVIISFDGEKAIITMNEVPAGAGDDTPAGENSMVAIFAILAVLAAAGVVTVVVAKRRAIEE